MTTQMMVILLGTIVCSFLAYIIYGVYKKYYSTPHKLVTVPLYANRSALLAERKKYVNERRRQISGESTVESPGKTENLKGGAIPESVDPMDAGFGEDLGLAIEQSREESAITLVKRRSRFADMRNAAEELRDVYNRNSKIQ